LRDDHDLDLVEVEGAAAPVAGGTAPDVEEGQARRAEEEDEFGGEEAALADGDGWLKAALECYAVPVAGSRACYSSAWMGAAERATAAMAMPKPPKRTSSLSGLRRPSGMG